ncbi:oxygen-dependent tRNA uridine(34) hydroxylase TrhO [Cellulosimicrobium marinum]|uniref:oxygen-dependent tRNA uridine(34) hydroxylase TrhO n=1 Tax=Cellulosimicrobium marinum TaxID=1638992 RepID=UPI001E4D4C99|nr:rhodanese-related sulfurtransferase [Cellulosimicrobium marinum]MCB7136744.1 rhodanese-related sulfurtransferase [Cellulosimicrobium marinum]
MAVHKIVLFYAFTPLPDPRAVQLWQLALAERWGLRGRVVVSPHGINATLGGTVEDLKQYVKTTRRYPGFEGTDVKWSDGTGRDFPRLSVKVRDELVAFGAADELVVDERGVVDGGERLSPQDLHDLVARRGDDVVMFDGRNAFEAAIGRFRGAVVPDVATTRDFVAEIDSGRYDDLKQRPVVTYCTGGVRCEVLSALLRRRGFEEVYQLDGGVVRYGEAFGSEGLWDGELYVFDGRMNVPLGPGSAPLGECTTCGAATGAYTNCADPGCRTLRLFCGACTEAARAERCPVCVEARPDLPALTGPGVPG